MIESKRILVFSTIVFLLLCLITWIMGLFNTVLGSILVIFYMLSLLIPYTSWRLMYPERLCVVPIFYIKYRRRYEELSREIREYLALIPSSSRVREVLEEILARD